MTQLRPVRSGHGAKPAHIASDILAADRGPGQADCVVPGAALMPLLDLLTVSIVLTNQDARILYANRRGAALLAEGRTLRNCMGRLSTANPKCALELRRAIVQATGKVKGDEPYGTPVPLAAQDRPELTAWILPLERVMGIGHEQAAIFVQERREAFSGELFMRRYGTTPAELRILELLVEGLTASEIGPALNITFNTVRTHLKSLFAKTGTCRQTQLVRLATCAVAPACLLDDAPGDSGWTRA